MTITGCLPIIKLIESRKHLSQKLESLAYPKVPTVMGMVLVRATLKGLLNSMGPTQQNLRKRESCQKSDESLLETYNKRAKEYH